ncbi:MAG: hypothetical protein KDB27_33500 [Planctomycetales bacterium]|nr:hypothetical protein [Planctomycetales bacterium]
MGLKVDLLEQSFAAVAPQGDKLTATFYRNLFNDFPEVKPLFANVDMTEQPKKLLASLKLAVDNLRKPEVLVPALENLGLRHVDYGTHEDHYPAVGQTLLKSLAEVAGDLWTEELNDAWAEAYGEITKIMLAGAAQPTG